jgi:uncharacterized protein (DUF2225 family)
VSEPIWYKEVKCPACDAVFKTPRVKSTHLKVKLGEPDFHKVYEGISPLLYAVTVCPECNYAARNDDFDKVTLEYHPEIVQIAKAIKASGKSVKFPVTADISVDLAVKKHLLAITFYRHWKPENPLAIAGLYMHAVWMYRESGNTEKEKEYLPLALEYYTKTFEKGIQIPEKIGEVGIIYLIGELNRMLGKYPEAVNWFSRVVKHDTIGNFPNIEHLAREAWEKITEEKRKPQVPDHKSQENNA